MVIKEFYKTRNDGVNLYRIYSDKNYMLRQIETDAIYDIAIDIENAPYTYEETDELIDRGYISEEEILAPDEISSSEFMALIEEAL